MLSVNPERMSLRRLVATAHQVHDDAGASWEQAYEAASITLNPLGICELIAELVHRLPAALPTLSLGVSPEAVAALTAIGGKPACSYHSYPPCVPFVIDSVSLEIGRLRIMAQTESRPPRFEDLPVAEHARPAEGL